MNISIFVSCFKYLNSFKLPVSLATWIYQELTKLKYNDDKLSKAFYCADCDIVDNIIKLTADKQLLQTLFDYCFDNCLDMSKDLYTFNIDLIKLFLNHDDVDVDNLNYRAVRKVVENNYTEILELLIDADAYLPSYLLMTAIEHCYVDIIKILLQNGVVEHNEKYIIECYKFTDEHAEIVKLLLSSCVFTIEIRKKIALKHIAN